MIETRPDTDALIPPHCVTAIEQLQLVLDGTLPPAALESDPHFESCHPCRDRLKLALVVLGTFPARAAPVIPSGLTDGILGAVREDRLARTRRRAFVGAGAIALAVAASFLVVSWLRPPPEPIVELVEQTPEPKAPPAGAPPMRITDEISKFSEAVVAISEPASKAPKIIGMITGPWSTPTAPAPEFDSARRSLAELPDAAFSGFEPVATTTQKAFTRLLKDVGAIQTNSKPKS